uniref:Uncharacterized protein n=1 Tax=Plectus sambesii TaxID=2011161 RepID=A0A914XMJ4_9BILA
MWYQTKGVRSSGLMGNEWESVELNSQLTNMNQPEFDPHLNYESLFDQCMRLLEEYHETPLDPLQLQQTYANVWLSLRGLKAKWQLEQRHASLALPTTSMNTTKSPLSQRDIYDLREKFQRFYSYLLRFSDAGSAQQMLIKDSMIIEWPTSVDSHDSDQSNDYGQPNPILVDRAPLLFISHSDKSTRVRRKYPTVQLRILALNQKTAPAAVQCRARIVRESVNRMEVEKYGKWQPAGKLIKVIKDGQKEHPNLSYEEDNEGLVANCGQLLTSPLQFDNSSTLVVQFSEIVRLLYCTAGAQIQYTSVTKT